MVKIAKIVNRYGKKYMVPLHKAKEMVRKEEIEDFDIIEVDRVMNFEKPQTQREFERQMQGIMPSEAEKENALLKEQIALLQQKAELEAKLSSAPAKVTEQLTNDEIKVPETVSDIEQLRADYEAKYGKEVANAKKNDAEWIQSKL